ncbi:hypothetical protein NL676_033630 [Syzygium grande]|nr:hypothetical protein NL676_033630 [Syzygium grande]
MGLFGPLGDSYWAFWVIEPIPNYADDIMVRLATEEARGSIPHACVSSDRIECRWTGRLRHWYLDIPGRVGELGSSRFKRALKSPELPVVTRERSIISPGCNPLRPLSFDVDCPVFD